MPTVAAFAVTVILVPLFKRARSTLPATRLGPLAPELVAFPLAVSLDDGYQRYAMLLLAGLACLAAARRGNRPSAPVAAGYLPIGLLLVATGVVFMAGGPLRTLLVVALAAGVLLLSTRKTSTRAAVDSLVVGLAVYLVANIVAWYAGMRSPAQAGRLGGYESSTSLFGGERIVFPFTSSIQEASIVAAVLLVALLVSRGENLRAVTWVGVGAAAFVLIGSNSRFPAVVALGVALTFLLAPRLLRRVAPPVVLAVMALPFYVTALGSLIQRAAELVVRTDYLARGQTVGEVAGLGTRVGIWEGGLYWWDEHVGWDERVFGFGQYGHAPSGAYATYMEYAGFLADPAALSLHNSLLQQLFDGGLIGIVALVAGLFMTMVRHGRIGGDYRAAVAVIVLGLCGTMEATLAPGFTSTPFFLLLAFAAFAPARYIHAPTRPRRRTGATCCRPNPLTPTTGDRSGRC